MGWAGQTVIRTGGETQRRPIRLSAVATSEPSKPQPADAPAATTPSSIVVLVPADRTRAWSDVLVEVLSARFGLPT